MNDLLRGLGLEADDPEARRLVRAADAAEAGAPAPRDWCYLAAALTRRFLAQPGAAPLVIGVSGGQGSGKTTLARRLVATLEAAGLRAAASSLDDFYLTRAERLALSRDVHPLLATRGVPGTHDVALLNRVLDHLGGPDPVALPLFDKATDDRLPRERWRLCAAPLDVFVLEGWCLGAEPEDLPALQRPVNALEAAEDPDGCWRRYVNDALAGPYRALWARLDRLVYLAVPDMAAVVRWRTEQESALPAQRRMSADAVARFVEHYERTTRQQAATLPRRADVVVQLNDAHGIATLRRNVRQGP